MLARRVMSLAAVIRPATVISPAAVIRPATVRRPATNAMEMSMKRRMKMLDTEFSAKLNVSCHSSIGKNWYNIDCSYFYLQLRGRKRVMGQSEILRM